MAFLSPGWAARRLELCDNKIADLNDRYRTAMEAVIESPRCQHMLEIYQSARKSLMMATATRQALRLALFGDSGAPPMWDSSCSTDDLSRFVVALPAQRAAIMKLIPGSVILLESGAAWLGIPFIATSDLFVRPAYSQLLCARDARFRARKVSMSRSETVFTGSPGAAGLSHFAGVFMGQQLLMGRDILFECREGRPRAPTRHFYWISSSSGVAHTEDKKAALEKLKQSKSQPIYIVDNCPAGIDRKSWQGEAVVFCSQHKGLWGDKASQRRDRLVLCVGPASIEELLSMKNALPKYRDMDDRTVTEWHGWAGGAIRACLRRASYGLTEFDHWKRCIPQVLSLTTVKELLEVRCLKELESERADVHSVLHWDYTRQLPKSKSSPKRRRKLRQVHQPCVRFASEQLRNMAVETMVPSKLVALAEACMQDGKTAKAYWMETMQRHETLWRRRRDSMEKCKP